MPSIHNPPVVYLRLTLCFPRACGKTPGASIAYSLWLRDEVNEITMENDKCTTLGLEGSI